MRSYLDFEKPVAEVDAKAEELKALTDADTSPAIREEVVRLEGKAAETLAALYAGLTPWQKTQVARHPQRPHALDYIAGMITDFTLFAGDRKFAEDEAIVGGLGRFRGESVCIIGHEKGSSTEARLKHNFGMARPEGYRKAVRLMDMADRFDLPVIALVDTPGAYPGIGAEERGQAEAIARSTDACLALGVPNVAVVIGEGGSGRGDCDRHRQPGADAAELDLQRDLAGGRRLDPVAGHRQGPGSGHQHEDHRRGPAALRRHRQDRAPSRSAARTATRRPPSRQPRTPSRPPSRSSAGWTARHCGASGATSSWRSDARRAERGPAASLETPQINPRKNPVEPCRAIVIERRCPGRADRGRRPNPCFRHNLKVIERVSEA